MKEARFRRRFLDERRQALRDSIDYFRTANTQQRNRWTCAELLANLGEPFDEHEILDPPSDPPDIVFRDAQFEVKEILDQGRRRHDEYKAKLKQAEAATDPSELLTHYTPKTLIRLALERSCSSGSMSLPPSTNPPSRERWTY